jgi:hypothetical protein
MMAASFATLIEVNYMTDLLHMTFGWEFVFFAYKTSHVG